MMRLLESCKDIKVLWTFRTMLRRRIRKRWGIGIKMAHIDLRLGTLFDFGPCQRPEPVSHYLFESSMAVVSFKHSSQLERHLLLPFEV